MLLRGSDMRNLDRSASPRMSFLRKHIILLVTHRKTVAQLLIMIRYHMGWVEQSAFSSQAYSVARDPVHCSWSLSTRWHRSSVGEGPSLGIKFRNFPGCMDTTSEPDLWGIGAAFKALCLIDVGCCKHDIESQGCPSLLGDVFIC